ncbi:Putative Nonribosomal peptide synthetase [Podospora comata]|uniref:Nonribosomal peptide synthetase n=1 Tax=Podospora comata TaxID=48703 RepID=A0ABY6SER0_PODCO|nr:Putative Nonribosomal peptide synthetase [Podospora comata]
MFGDDDIFFEVGGDSVMAQRLITAARRQGIHLTMEQIFLNAALADMAEVARVVNSTVEQTEEGLEAASGVPSPLGDHITLKDREILAKKCNVAAQDIEKVYSCTPMQESLLAEFDDRKTLYMRQFVFKLDNHVAPNHFRQAWEDTIQANPVLRTRICQLEGRTGNLQVVLSNDLGQWDSVDVDLKWFLERDAASPMLPGDPFFRYTVVEDKDTDGGIQRHFVWTVHHALCDGASIPEVFDDVSRRFRNEPTVERQPFEAFVRSSTVTPDLSSEQSFWKRSLSGLNPTPYPPIPQDPHFHADPASLFERTFVLDFSPLHGATKALMLRAAWAILLSHYTGTEDVGFGAVNNGRTATVPGVSEMTGPTINLVPIALHVDPQEPVASFLSRVRVQAAEMIPFEHAGISRIRKHLAGTETTAVNFQTLFVVHPMSFDDAIGAATQTLGLKYIDALGKKEHHPYPLVITLTLSAGNNVKLAVQHDERLVPIQQAENMVHHFEVVLKQLGRSTKDAKLASISPFSDHDLRQIRRWNAFTPPVEETTIHHLFQQQVKRQPNAVAVCSLEGSLTYLEVDEHSSSLATQLVDAGVSTGTFVGVCFDKSIWTVVAILAVFKAGGIYVPIDPAHPRSRIEESVERVGIEVALASDVGARVLDGLCRYVITLNGPPPAPRADAIPPFNSVPSSIAYLLFTSGSTGKPKGLLMSHSAICTSIVHHGREFAAGPHWRTLQFGAHTFDLSIGEFFTTLAHGGCICVPSEEDRLNNLAGAITALNANTMLVVPTVANLLHPMDVPTIRTIVLAGEPITKETVTRWADSADLTCAYGPSETAVWCSGNLRVSTDAHPGNIGKAIGASMWIVNPEDYHQLSAIGCVGEIVISGGLLGGGYFGDKALTDAAWVPAPSWLKELGSGYDVLYRSGDLARYNPDGTFQIVGRRDTQVKLRGFRIELGEIENQLMATGMITAALAALPTAGPCARNIVAIVCSAKSNLKNHNHIDIVVSKEERPLLERLKVRLSRSLPDYMIPTIWVALEQMPLLISGKIDRKSIKTWIQNMDYGLHRELVEDPDAEAGQGSIVPGSLAESLRQLWSEVLHVPEEHIELGTSFIAIGGDSIAAIQIASQAKKKWGLSATVRSIINTKTLGHLVELVEESSKASIPMSPPEPTQLRQWVGDDESLPAIYRHILHSRLQDKPSVTIEHVYPFAPFQREILKARKFNPAVFLLSWRMEVFSLANQPVALERLAQAWKRVVQKHTILRSIFLEDPSGNLPPVQAVLKKAEPEIAISSASAEEPEPTFISTQTPLVDDCFLPHRAHFIQHGERFFVHIELDHLVIDGWSLKLIKEAFLSAYEENGEGVLVSDEPPPYGVFVAVHHPDRVSVDNEHWALVLRDQKPSLLPPPVGYPQAHPSLHSTEKTIIYLPEIQASSLKPFSFQHSITPASIFDAAWAQTLSAYTNSTSVAFEYVVSGRDEDVPGVFDIVGPLINVLPYHIDHVLSDGDPEQLARLAQRMQSQRDEDSSHTSSNVREVIETELGVKKLFNTAVNFQRRPTAVETSSLRVDDDLRKSRDPWHFDVLVRVMHITDDDTFKPSFEFDELLFDKDGMTKVAEDFWGRVKALVA